GVYKFKKPNNPNFTFTIPEIENLITLLKSCPPNDNITVLLNTIDQCMIDNRDKISLDEKYKKELGCLDDQTKIHIKNWCRTLFKIGMYMRRWNGPGYPYPLKENDTKGEFIHHFTLVTAENNNLTNLLDKMSKRGREFCLNLKQCEYN